MASSENAAAPAPDVAIRRLLIDLAPAVLGAMVRRVRDFGAAEAARRRRESVVASLVPPEEQVTPRRRGRVSLSSPGRDG